MAYQPKVIDSWLTEPYMGLPGRVRYHNRNWAGIQGIVVHVQEGWNNGTKQHFRAVKASSTVLISRTGLIERLVPESKAPWTNGDVMNPDSQIRALMAKYGPDPNTWTLTIECEGFTGGLPYSEEQYQAILWQIREWRKKYGKVPVLAHRQINSVTRTNCPEPPGGKFLPRLYADIASGTDAPAGKFEQGDTVRFTERLNVRRAWTLSSVFEGKPNVIATMPEDTIATIINGPNYADDYTWWDVAIDGVGTGHVAEPWLELTDEVPPKPIPPKQTFATRFELPLREDAGFNGVITEYLPEGTTGEIVEGPIDADTIGWYLITTDSGKRGWLPASIMHTLSIDS